MKVSIAVVIGGFVFGKYDGLDLLLHTQIIKTYMNSMVISCAEIHLWPSGVSYLINYYSTNSLRTSLKISYWNFLIW